MEIFLHPFFVFKKIKEIYKTGCVRHFFCLKFISKLLTDLYYHVDWEARMSVPQPIRSDFTAGFQIKFILAMVLGALLTTLAIYFYLDQGLGPNYFDALATLSTVEAALTSSLVITFCLQLFLIFILTIGLTLFVSHKIAGPVFRYEGSLTEILEGDLRTDVRTRDGDQLKSMIDSMNLWQNSLRDIYTQANLLERELLSQVSRAETSTAYETSELLDSVEKMSRILASKSDAAGRDHE
jgi:methyl-accepting chemotaxis protein